MSDTWLQEWKAQAGTEGRPNMIRSSTGTKLKVVTYNVAEYCMKPSSGAGKAFIWDKPEKLQALRRWVGETDADLMLMTEDATYLDKAETKKATMLIYNDRLPAQQGGWVRIRAKMAVEKPKKTDGTALTVVAVRPTADASKTADGKKPGNRYFTFGWVRAEGKNVLVVTVHPWNSAIKYKAKPKSGPVQQRMHYLQTVFDLVYCLRSKKVMEGLCGTAPWDYCVIGGDFNTSNRNGMTTGGSAFRAGTEDWDNLAKLRDYYRFDSANGGYLGWIATYPSNGEALDNILVSGNVILNGIRNEVDKKGALYSDHVPLVTTMTLADGAPARFPEKTFEGKSAEKDTAQLRRWLGDLMDGEIGGPCV